MRLTGLLILGVALANASAQDTVSTLELSDVLIHVVRHNSTLPGPLYFNMHDDENTSVEAMDTILGVYGGTLYELSHNGERNISFVLDSFEYEFDPNRIYTNAGIWREIRKVHVRDSIQRMELFWKLLEKLIIRGVFPDPRGLVQVTVDTSGQTDLASDTTSGANGYIFSARDSSAFNLIRWFSDSLLSIMQIDSQEIVVALHNNREDGYSMASYKMDSIYQTEALAVYVGWHVDPDDFYFVTDRRLFEALQPNNFHIVLQDNSLMTDDGSLSVYCGQRGIAYVNVEAQHDHRREQTEMLQILNARLFTP